MSSSVKKTRVMPFGNEEDFTAALGFKLQGVDHSYAQLPLESFRAMIRAVMNGRAHVLTERAREFVAAVAAARKK